MKSGVRIRASEGFHQCRESVEMLVAVSVVAHGASLGDVSSFFQSHGIALCHGEEDLHRIQRLAHVSTAGEREMADDFIRKYQLPFRPGILQPYRPVYGYGGVFRSNRLELENSGAAEYGVEHTKVRVLCSGSDQSDPAVLDELKQGLLLFLIKILDLVEIQKNTARSEKSIEVTDYCLNVGNTCSGGIELSQGAVGPLGNDPCDGGFTCAGRAVEDHIRDLSALHDAAEHAVFTQNMLLPDDVVK